MEYYHNPSTRDAEVELCIWSLHGPHKQCLLFKDVIKHVRINNSNFSTDRVAKALLFSAGLTTPGRSAAGKMDTWWNSGSWRKNPCCSGLLRVEPWCSFSRSIFPQSLVYSASLHWKALTLTKRTSWVESQRWGLKGYLGKMERKEASWSVTVHVAPPWDALRFVVTQCPIPSVYKEVIR